MKNYTLKKIFRISLILLSFVFLPNFSSYAGVKTATTSVYITTPDNGSFLHSQNGKVNIAGSAYLNSGFMNYYLYYSPKDSPNNLKPILPRYATTMVRDSSLGVWNAAGIADGEYQMILIVTAIVNGKPVQIYDRKYFTLDNVNEAPKFVNLHNYAYPAGASEPFILKLEAKDPDDPATPQGQLNYSYKFIGSNPIPDFNFNPQTQIVSWQPSAQDKGKTYQVNFSVKDNLDTHTDSKTISFSAIDVKKDKIRTFTQAEPWPPRVLIYGDRVVWIENGAENGTYLYDLTADQQNKLAKNYFPYGLYKNKLLSYAANSASNSQDQLLVYDLLSKEEIRIPANCNLTNAMFLGNRIVWSSTQQQGQISLYTNDQATPITTGKLWPNAFDFNQKLMVFENLDDGWSYSYDFAQKQTTRLFKDLTFFLRVYEDNMVYSVYYPKYEFNPNAYTVLKSFQLGVNKPGEIDRTKGANSLMNFALYKDRVVYAKEKIQDGINPGIYLYIPSTDTQIRVDSLTEGTKHSIPQIFGNRIVWTDLNNLYLERVSLLPIVESISPLTLKPGEILTIGGKNFGDQQEESQVQFANAAVCEIQSWSDTTITCKVPMEAVSGLVKVINAAGESNGIGVTIQEVAPLAPSEFNALINNANQVDLTWKNNATNNTGFKLERRKEGEANFKNIASLSKTDTTYTDTGLVAGAKYYYRLKATNTRLDSPGVEASATTIVTIPAVPTDLYAWAISSSQIKMNWADRSDNEDGFKIERSVFPDKDFSQIATMGPNSREYGDYGPGLKVNTTYYYRIRAYNSKGDSDYSNVANATTIEDIPAAPTNLTANAVSARQVDLSWTDNSQKEDGFKIEIRAASENKFREWAKLIGSNITSYSVIGIAPDNLFFFRVCAYN
ncbi:MAG: fibronectin type III domain-containing protein, partial [Candidatus Omnitrophica bacterium]|nr:fibronectin type III domain-containing protein [Candidatus Omnitrophota bacterium]